MSDEPKKKVDRRVKYTKMVLTESLLKLLHDKPLNKITVKALCETADVNRGTFYSHYADQYELFDEIKTNFINNINDIIDLQEETVDIYDMLNKLFEYVAQFEDTYVILLNKSSDETAFFSELLTALHKKDIERLKLSYGFSNEKAKVLSSFLIGGTTMAIKNWLEDGMKIPPSEMARYCEKLFKSCIENYNYL